MNKTYFMIVLLTAASAVFIAIPTLLDYLHWLVIVTSGHHLAGELVQSVHQKKG